jgi:D-alanine-D-alanine ligase-like ATP-grasp enzyme
VRRRKIMIEKKVYNGWAFTENEKEKGKINREIYKELKEKYKILKTCDWDFRYPTQEELDENDIVYSRRACYLHGEYRLYKSPQNITEDELLLIFDEGNLCFGGRYNGAYYYVSED